jgi:DNA-binding beta-propeller fold protein YncE
VLDAGTGRLITSIRAGRGAHGIALNAARTLAFVTNTYEHTMTVIDLRELVAKASFPTGKGPNGVAAD